MSGPAGDWCGNEDGVSRGIKNEDTSTGSQIESKLSFPLSPRQAIPETQTEPPSQRTKAEKHNYGYYGVDGHEHRDTPGRAEKHNYGYYGVDDVDRHEHRDTPGPDYQYSYTRSFGNKHIALEPVSPEKALQVAQAFYEKLPEIMSFIHPENIQAFNQQIREDMKNIKKAGKIEQYMYFVTTRFYFVSNFHLNEDKSTYHQVDKNVKAKFCLKCKNQMVYHLEKMYVHIHANTDDEGFQPGKHEIKRNRREQRCGITKDLVKLNSRVT